MKTQGIPFHRDAGHVLLDLGGVTTLLDTGSPLSFGDVPEVALLGKRYSLRPELPGGITVRPTVEGLRRDTPVSASFTFQALLGLDILAGLTLELDWEAGQLTVTRAHDGAASRGRVLSLADVEVEGRRLAGFVDTGAWRTYLVPEAAAGLPRTGSFRDYNPILGVITPHLVKARLGYEGHERVLEVGEAPPTLATMIRSAGADVLVGTDVLVPMGRTVLVMPSP